MVESKENEEMNKTELVAKMSEVSGLTKKDSESALKAFQDVVTDVLYEGGKVQLVGFGTFERTERKPRMTRNPKTNEELGMSEGGFAPKFKAGKQLKESVKAGK